MEEGKRTVPAGETNVIINFLLFLSYQLWLKVQRTCNFRKTPLVAGDRWIWKWNDNITKVEWQYHEFNSKAALKKKTTCQILQLHETTEVFSVLPFSTNVKLSTASLKQTRNIFSIWIVFCVQITALKRKKKDWTIYTGWSWLVFPERFHVQSQMTETRISLLDYMQLGGGNMSGGVPVKSGKGKTSICKEI